MDPQVRKKARQGIKDVVAGEPLTMSHTHPLKGPMKGWHSSEVNGAHGYRVIHQPNDKGGIHIGYVGLHEYGDAQRRLGSKGLSMPPDPGTAPIPKGHVRLWHYTRPEHVDSIRENGLLNSRARGDGGGGPSEPSAGVWASNQKPKETDLRRAPHIEFHAHPDEISGRADDPPRSDTDPYNRGSESPEEWSKGLHHVIMKGDVKPHQIVGIHEQWHPTARYMRDSGGVESGKFDWLGDPEQCKGLEHEPKAYQYLKSQQGKTAKVRHAPKSDEPQTGIMIAIVPPASVVESLVLDEGEPAHELHITLAYLGDADEYSEALLGNLHEVVESWAESQAKFTALIQGVGTFLPADDDGEHVLWASIGSPRLHRMQASLVDHLKGHGYSPRENHGFTAHLTLAYGKHHFRFVPKVKRQEFKVHEIWVVVAGRWESITLNRAENKKSA